MRNTKRITVFLLSVLLVPVINVQAQTETPMLVDAADYPRIVELEGGTVTIHHPTIRDWKDFKTLSGWIAVEVMEKGAEDKWIGSVLMEAQTDIDFDERLVVLHHGVIKERNFAQGAPSDQVRSLIEEAVVRRPRSVLLDVLLRALPEDFEIPRQGVNTPELNFDPPRIVVSTTPLQLMFINGEPVAAPIEGTSLEFLVNTNWDVLHDTAEDRWYVLNNGAWQVSNSLVSGAWETTTKLPKDIEKLPADENWAAVHAALPAVRPEKDPAPIVVSMEPTELILLDGEPELVAITGTAVRQVANTQSDLFELEGRFYYLASGRWFEAGDLAGDWSAVKAIPQEFALIPPEHEKGHVLVSVPGTADSRAALIEASIPRSASISKDAGEELRVDYAGEPQFVSIEGTELTRAVNTPYQIIVYNSHYYLCYNAVWYVSIKADGPWSVATNIPKEIYQIPATDPAHNVTYVFVDSYDDDYVNYNYTSGYTGTFAVSLVIVYGSGWYYNPYSYYHYGYPACWHYPHTYGYGAWYNPATGTYGQRAVGYGPYGGVASGAVYNPRTGAYARGQSVWDNDELARRGYGYNPSNNSFAAGNMYYDFDDNEGWRQSYVQRGDNWVYSNTTLDGNKRSTEYATSRGVEGTSEREWNNDVMTGSGTFEGENFSGTTRSHIDEDGASLSVDRSRGGNLDVSKEAGESGREISGSTAGGTGFSGETQRSGDGGFRTDLESDAGGSAIIKRDDGNRSFAGQSAEGDLYAGHNGNVYKKTDDGWSQYGDGGWSTAERTERDYGSGRASSQSRNQDYSSQLNRQYDARQSGQRNYNSFQTQRSFGQGSRQRSGGRRRR